MENEIKDSRGDAEARRKLVWVVRWIPNGKNNCVFKTQNERLRVFDSLEAAEAFTKELGRRIKHLWIAATGEERCGFYNSGICGNIKEPGGYRAVNEYMTQWEIVCVELNVAEIRKWEIDYENA